MLLHHETLIPPTCFSGSSLLGSGLQVSVCPECVCLRVCPEWTPGACGEDRTCLTGERRGRSPRPAWLSGCCLWAVCSRTVCVCVCVCVCVLAVKCVLVMQYSQLQVVLKTRKTSCKVQVGVRNLENV